MAQTPAGMVRRPGSRLVLVGLVAAFSAVVFFLGYLALREPDRSPIEISGIGEAQRIFGGVAQSGPRLGSNDAPVTLTVFDDVQCGDCAEWFSAVVPPLVEEYVRDDEVRMVYRDYSFARSPIELAFYGAEAAAEQGYRWQYVYLFTRSVEEAEQRGVTDRFLETVAASIPDMDVPRWREDFATLLEPDSPFREALLANDEFARQLGLRAEPSVMVAGPGGRRILQDSPPLEEIEGAIAEVE